MVIVVISCMCGLFGPNGFLFVLLPSFSHHVGSSGLLFLTLFKVYVLHCMCEIIVWNVMILIEATAAILVCTVTVLEYTTSHPGRLEVGSPIDWILRYIQNTPVPF